LPSPDPLGSARALQTVRREGIFALFVLVQPDGDLPPRQARRRTAAGDPQARTRRGRRRPRALGDHAPERLDHDRRPAPPRMISLELEVLMRDVMACEVTVEAIARAHDGTPIAISPRDHDP